MINRILVIIFSFTFSVFAGCTYITQGLPDPNRGAESVEDDYFGDSAKKIIYLDQNWDAADSLWFYNTTQGSDLIPYDIFLNLQQVNSSELFRNSKNMRKFRYLTQNPTYDNPDGLPVGFVADNYDGRKYLGFTCAACHTTQINYTNKEGSYGIRIDGGPALADMDSMLRALEKALVNTLRDPSKLKLLERAIRTSDDASEIDTLKARLQETTQQIASYNKTNLSHNDGISVEYGYARLDAFGRIYNRILAHIKPVAPSYNSPNAPVSYPFLWDTPQYDFVQWNGVGNNNAGGITGYFGPLGRNVGEVLGVFATFEVTSEPGGIKKLSADKHNIVRLEEHLETLKSPQWPEHILGDIKRDKALRGAKVFHDYACAACHIGIDTVSNEALKHGIPARFTSVDRIGTDKQMALNAVGADGDTGLIAGKKNPISGDNFTTNEAVVASLTKVTSDAILAADETQPFFIRWAKQADILIRSLLGNPVKEPTHRNVDFQEQPTELYAYKARSLNGIWATAPYLHNGSVPNLYELFLPACSDTEIASGKECRSNTFTLGSRELDVERVGFIIKDKNEYDHLFTYDTSIPGNSNHGHEYAAGITPIIQLDNQGLPIVKDGKVQTALLPEMSTQQRKDLVEYLKTL